MLTWEEALAPPEERELSLLTSFHFFGRVSMMDRPPHVTVYADSGAFSVAASGGVVDIQQYGAWLRRNKTGLDLYASLDVIHDPVASWANQLRMESWGLKPVPVLHAPCSLDWLRRYADRGTTYAALGGIQKSIRRCDELELHRWLGDAHALAEDLGISLHGFAVTDGKMMRRYPWKSVDSSSWSAGFRFFAPLQAFDPTRGVWVRERASGPRVARTASILRRYGVSPVAIANNDRRARAMIIKLSARSWFAYQRWAQKAWDRPGFRVYLAQVQGNDFKTVIQAVASLGAKSMMDPHHPQHRSP